MSLAPARPLRNDWEDHVCREIRRRRQWRMRNVATALPSDWGPGFGSRDQSPKGTEIETVIAVVTPTGDVQVLERRMFVRNRYGDRWLTDVGQ